MVLLLVLWAAVAAGPSLVPAVLLGALPLLLPLPVTADEAALEPVLEALAGVVVAAAPVAAPPVAVEQATAVGRSATPKPLQNCRSEKANVSGSGSMLSPSTRRGASAEDWETTHAGSEGHGRGLRRGVADAHQAAGDAAEEVLVAADALRIAATVADAASQELVGTALLE